MALRQTAAARVVEIDFQIPTLIVDLGDADDRFAAVSEEKVTAQREYDAAKKAVEHEKNIITEALLGQVAGTKITQAEIDRKLKSELFNNDVFRDLEDKLFLAKVRLDDVTSAFELVRIHHRTLVSQLGAASAALNFMSASKTARAIALQNLTDV
jgi:hypothetical protein